MIEFRKYTPGEVFANVFTHLLAALMSLYCIVMFAIYSKSIGQFASTAIFGITLFLLFLSSVCYHSVTNEAVKRVFQKIDHSAIYMLIAGTYTPALVLAIKFPLDLIMVVIIWFLAVMGIIFSCIKLKPKYLSTGLYLFMGWLSIIFVYNVWMISHLSVWLFLIGGIFYSIGCFFYLIKFPYTHFVWHVFVMAGAAMHYFAIMELLKVVNL